MDDHLVPGPHFGKDGGSPPLKAKPPRVLPVLGTPLRVTTYDGFTVFCQALRSEPRPFAVDFSNTQIVTMRRHEREFRKLTSKVDFFVPDGMPLIWCLNRKGAQLRDRVYGPTFMRKCVLASPAPITHYFLGGSDDCIRRLKGFFLGQNPNIQIVGARNGYFSAGEDDAIVEEINRLSPDFIWVGMGTPRQQWWIHKNKERMERGILFAVGFAFDVNAGTKQDAPAWLQRLGLTWSYRLLREPARLGPRYLKYNSLFVFYLGWDGMRGGRTGTGRD
jgi:N-acetylglucosaminyldiphosphoundecaprenol N-acetyl-beta-D-mannosaminyltransferase